MEIIKNYDEFILESDYADTPFDYKNQITLPSSIRTKVNVLFNKMGDYFRTRDNAFDEIFNTLKTNGITVLQEDFTPFNGFFTGRSGKASLEIGYNNKVVKNSKLIITWYDKGSGASPFEFIKYLS